MGHPNVAEKEAEPQGCRCPFCDSAMEMPFPFCKDCGSEIAYCQVCGEPLPQGAEVCPHCAEER